MRLTLTILFFYFFFLLALPYAVRRLTLYSLP